MVSDESFSLLLGRLKRIEHDLERTKTVENPVAGGGGGGVIAPTARGDMLAADATPAWDILALGGWSGYVLTRNATDPIWSNTLSIGADANIGLIIKGHSATQTANLQEWQTSAGALLAGIDELGNLLFLNTTHAQPSGIIYKGANLFLHDFNYGNNGIVTTQGRNTFVGEFAGNLTMGATANDASLASNNTGVGYAALWANTGGYQNVAVGTYALIRNQSGNRNVCIGAYAMQWNTSGYLNVAIGNEAMTENVSAYHNVAIGHQALLWNSVGNANVAIGNYALSTNRASGNVAVGHGALYQNNTGTRVTAVGYAALEQNFADIDNTAVGFYAARWNRGDSNTAMGSYALELTNYADLNAAIGFQAMQNNVTGYYNTACGANALHASTTSDYNTALGHEALYVVWPTSKAITAFSNYSGTVPGTVRATSTAHGFPVGTTALIQISGTSGAYDGIYTITYIDANSFYFTHAYIPGPIGYWSYSVQGHSNTGIGAAAGHDITIGSQNTFLGKDAGNHASQKVDAVNSMALGYAAYTTKDNQVVIGTTDITETLLYGLVGIETTPAAQLDVCQNNAAGAIPCLELDQDDVDDAFINFVGDTAADQTKSISTVNGDGTVTGPLNFSASAGWEYVGMLKIEINGSAFWVAYYQPDTS